MHGLPHEVHLYIAPKIFLKEAFLLWVAFYKKRVWKTRKKKIKSSSEKERQYHLRGKLLFFHLLSFFKKVLDVVLCFAKKQKSGWSWLSGWYFWDPCVVSLAMSENLTLQIIHFTPKLVHNSCTLKAQQLISLMQLPLKTTFLKNIQIYSSFVSKIKCIGPS